MGPVDPANCCCDEDGGGGGPFCRPFGWINPCSIGWYVSDKCETPYTFRIRKNGEVIVGPSVAKSYTLTPPFGEVASYAIEVCEGTIDPCAWTNLIGPVTVDTTGEEPCPMGVKGQTYVVGIPPFETAPEPTGLFVYCQSSLVIRASALADFGQQITHLWIDDELWTPNTNFAGGIATEGGGDPLSISFMCESGKPYGNADVSWNDTSLPQVRLPLPIPFEKASFSVRARQTNGMIVGCVVGCNCTVHYNAAAVTLPSWDGVSFACGANGGKPIGWDAAGPQPGSLIAWSKRFDSSLDIVPTTSMPGTFAWRTCQSSTPTSFVVGLYDCTYKIKVSGDVKWLLSAPGSTVQTGTFEYDFTATWQTELVLDVPSYTPGGLGGVLTLTARIVNDTLTTVLAGHNDAPLSIRSSILGGGGGVSEFDYWSQDWHYLKYLNPVWFWSTLFDGLGCGPPPYDGDTFQWNWQGPRFSSEFWSIDTDLREGVDPANWTQIVPWGLQGSNTATMLYLNANWPVGTNFKCDLPEDGPYGGYYEVTESAVATQFQV